MECKLLGRRALGEDINPDAVMVARNRLDFSYAPPIERDIYLGLCRNLERLSNRLKIGYFFAPLSLQAHRRKRGIYQMVLSVSFLLKHNYNSISSMKSKSFKSLSNDATLDIP